MAFIREAESARCLPFGKERRSDGKAQNGNGTDVAYLPPWSFELKAAVNATLTSLATATVELRAKRCCCVALGFLAVTVGTSESGMACGAHEEELVAVVLQKLQAHRWPPRRSSRQQTPRRQGRRGNTPSPNRCSPVRPRQVLRATRRSGITVDPTSTGGGAVRSTLSSAIVVHH
ncbi:hypothetical protein E2562_028111 [Oryza meyeriana var. granulata]|uniref:Uncharacterized protein n=1 Tax=Oryza meyeriana var. granulata TaxID=110450 RepID=A0A6G1CAI9_9ORYZ|nr:hypothetical protein E2562_028111 [Oryza meyeriana var. granulata]